MTARNDYLAEDQSSLAGWRAAPRLDAPVSDDAWSDSPWAEWDATATVQRVQTAIWIEEILADLDHER